MIEIPFTPEERITELERKVDLLLKASRELLEAIRLLRNAQMETLKIAAHAAEAADAANAHFTPLA